ncbi:hypothetical protein HRI_005153800 [Hibiscus trionum]|uniref:Transcription factor Iwr1 domain-containing protein n=1 Tax=Hibiscus trionum TaxID=183268 RepID=A0A9W7MXL4_HIBTR|nr:hypothetical protein HRI_005153800 [Hibiscus trionum]
MASNGESSSATPQSTADKPVIVRVKRKVSQSRLDAFWLEINERPLKRPFSDFQNLSISESSQKEELKSKKVFVQHVDTVVSSRATVDIVQSFIPNSADATDGKTKSREGRRPQKIDYRQEQLSKSIQKQEAIAKNARFEQIWRRRRGKKEAVDEMCHFYDVVRVDVEEKSNSIQIEERFLEDQKLLSSYLPLLKEFIPAAVAEIESDMREYLLGKEQYVYDYYTVKDDLAVDGDMASNPFPLVTVDDEDFYDVPYESEYDSEDSNAEDNPRNDYPDEISDEEEEEEEDESRSSSSIKSSEVGSLGAYDEDLLYEVDSCDASHGDDADYLGHGNSDYGPDGGDWRWSYR